MTQQSFWRELPRPFFILAPMEAVTDVVFRHVVKTASPPDVYYTEFTNATGWVNAGKVAIGARLEKADDEFPLVAQLWGSIPKDIAALAKYCAQQGFHGIDINMGCPDKSAVKAGGGAALIKNPTLASEIIAAAKESGLPVSVKTRLGYSKLEEKNQWLQHILEQNIEALTVHLRTKKEMSKVDAHWELMPEIVDLRNHTAKDTLLIGNGDVQDRKHGEELCTQYGIDGVMVGRGVFHNPFAFERQKKSHTKEELLDLLHLQLDLFDTYNTAENPRRFDPLKRFFKIYVREFEGANELRHNLMQTHSTDEVRKILS